MSVIRYRDRLLWFPVELRFWRWHGVPVMAAIAIGKMTDRRPHWTTIALTVATQALLIYAAFKHLPLTTVRWVIPPQ